MNIQTEIKRVCALNSYLELIQKNQEAIDVCNDKISNGAELFGMDFKSFYIKRLKRQKELSEFLQKRYLKILQNA